LSNGLDKSCEATIYPVLDKPHKAGALGSPGASNYRRYIRYLSALLSARDAWIEHLNAVYCALLFMGHA